MTWKDAFTNARSTGPIRPAGWSGPTRNVERKDLDLAKYARLKGRRNALRAALHDVLEEYRNVRSERMKLESLEAEARARGGMTSFRRVRVGTSPSGVSTDVLTPETVEHRLAPETARTLEALREKERQLVDNRDSLKREAAPLSRLCSNIESFLRSLKIDPDNILPSLAAPPRVAARKKAKPDDVERVRARIKENQHERKRLARGHVSQQEAEQSIDRSIEEAAARFDRLDTRTLHRADASLAGLFSPAPVVSEFSRDPDGNIHAVPNMHRGNEGAELIVGLFAKLEPSKLRKVLLERDRAIAEARGGYAAGDWTERIAALERELFDLELEEEGIVVALEGAGVPVARRPDASPAAVLHLEPELEAA